LRWALARIPLTSEEKERLEQEDFAKRGYVPMLERLLTAVDDSPSGRLASWLAGLLAGPRGMPVTVVELELAAPKEKAAETEAPAVVEAAMEEAQPRREAEAEATPKSDRNVEVRRRTRDEKSEEIIAAEADKGFDLLWIGTEHGVDLTGAISPLTARIVRRFEGDFSLCFARGEKAKHLEAEPLHLLVPITGTAYSRKAVEVALALAQASNGSVTALHVGRMPQSWTGKLRRSMTIDQEALAILKEVSDLARIYGARVQTRMEASSSADRAILRAAARDNYSAILMGVTPRPGDTLHFGNVPQAVLANTPLSVVLVSS
jgi:nucleotide-binding universal stress UspA family protein